MAAVAATTVAAAAVIVSAALAAAGVAEGSPRRPDGGGAAVVAAFAAAVGGSESSEAEAAWAGRGVRWSRAAATGPRTRPRRPVVSVSASASSAFPRVQAHPATPPLGRVSAALYGQHECIDSIDCIAIDCVPRLTPRQHVSRLTPWAGPAFSGRRPGPVAHPNAPCPERFACRLSRSFAPAPSSWLARRLASDGKQRCLKIPSQSFTRSGPARVAIFWRPATLPIVLGSASPCS